MLRSIAPGLVIAGLLACASGDVLERDWPRDGPLATAGPVHARLHHATWLPRGIELELSLRNSGSAPIEVDPAGILVAYEGLEYPLAAGAGADAVLATAPPITVAPGQGRDLRLVFFLGRRPAESAWLVLRVLRDPSGARPPLWLELPPTPLPRPDAPRRRRARLRRPSRAAGPGPAAAPRSRDR